MRFLLRNSSSTVRASSISAGPYTRLLDDHQDTNLTHSPYLLGMDSLLSKKRKEESASSSSFSPTGPTLESPTTFQLSTTRPIVTEATIKPKNKSERVAAMPSMFLEEKEVDEKAMMDLDRGAPADPVPVSAAHGSIEDEETVISKQKYFEEAFATRGQRNSSRIDILFNAILVVEMKISTRVSLRFVSIPCGSLKAMLTS